MVLFVSETIPALIADNQIFAHLFLFAALFSVLLGLSIGIVIRLFLGTVRFSGETGAGLAAVAVSIILVQGGIITNYLFMFGARALSPPSLAVDTLWIFLCLFLYTLLLILLKKNPVLQGTKLTMGLFLSAVGMALLSIYYDRPNEILYSRVLFQVISTFVVCVVCFYVASVATGFLYHIVRKRGGGKNAAPRVLVIQAAFVILIIFVYLFSRFDGGKKWPAVTDSGRNAPNVFLFVIDTLRADHLSCYGYEFETSPNIDEFSHEALRFENCYSTANWTVPGHASLFTGRYPISHGAHKMLGNDRAESGIRNPFFCFPLGSEEVTLAEILRDSGYRTAAVVSNHGCVSEAFGLDQGFDHFFSSPPFTYKPVIYTIIAKLSFFHDIIGPYFSRFRVAENINEKVLDWLDRNGDAPFFMFVNYMDTHDPYFPPRAYQDRFPGRIENHHTDIHLYGIEHKTIGPGQIDHLRSQYDGEIAYLDTEIGRLFSTLKVEGLFDNSIIILTSDHGEYLGEHQLFGHSVGLYEAVIKVPLIIKPQGSLVWKTQSDRPVQIIDILPTVLRLLNIDIPEGVQGTPLMQEASHPIVSEHYVGPNYRNTYDGHFFEELVSVVEGDLKYIHSGRKQSELFDLSDDPTEIRNIAGDGTGRSDLLLLLLEQWRETVEVKELDAESLPGLDDGTLRNLKALGYIE